MSARRGFTLIEVIVALMVAGVLCSAFLGSQAQNIFFIDHAALNWEQVNFAQQLLTEHDQATLSATMDWVPDPDDGRREWMVESRASALGVRNRMTTSVDGAKAEWEWVQP